MSLPRILARADQPHEGGLVSLGLDHAAHLRSLRLNAVRQRLLATPAGTPDVSQAAGEAGFSHLGHFGTRYRQLFGELPSQTLRKTASS